MIQAGSESDFIQDVGSEYKLWWQITPGFNQQVTTVDVLPGDWIYAAAGMENTSYGADPESEAEITIFDERTGENENTRYIYSGSFGFDGYIEWIEERTAEESTYPMLTDAPTTDANGDIDAFTDYWENPGTVSSKDCGGGGIGRRSVGIRRGTAPMR